MFSLKVPLKDAQHAKELIMQKKLYDFTRRIAKTKKDIYFPITQKMKLPWTVVNKTLEPVHDKEKTLKSALEHTLTKKEQEFLANSYDVAGGIAILEIPPELKKREKLIATTVLRMRPAISTVLKKSGIHAGEFRTQKLTYLAGKRTKEARYAENGCTFLVDVEKVYFSVRLAHERLRIVNLVKPGEKILVMFSGCAPYPIVLSKHTLAKEIMGIELNPVGHEYGLKNVALNKVKNVNLICGDVAKEAIALIKHGEKFDRILMPLPKSAIDYLHDALALSKKGTVIHFYAFVREDEYERYAQVIADKCKARGVPVKILGCVPCGQHAPYVFRVSIDLEVQ